MKHQTTRYGEIPFYKIGTFGNTADAFISKKLFLEYKTKYSFPKKGDILISASGTIGRAVIYDGKPAYFQDSNIVWIDNDETLVKNDFLFYAYSNVKWNTEHTTILRLYNDNFRNTLIPLPPLDEQIAIANILSDLDRYLDALDALILKKEGVKKALSFELLSQILASNGVEFRKLGEILKDLGKGNRPASFQDANGAYNFYKSSLEIYKCAAYDFDTEAIIIGDGGVANIHYCKGKFSATDHTYIFEKSNDELSLKYVYFVIRNNLNLLQSGFKGSSLQNIAKKFIKEQITIPIPPLEIQQEIANILSDLDKEIASLKNKKRQFENIKKALNHDLMSAKIRVLKK
ncbi:hypothetical protein ID0983_04750 [Helicobacter pylori]